MSLLNCNMKWYGRVGKRSCQKILVNIFQKYLWVGYVKLFFLFLFLEKSNWEKNLFFAAWRGKSRFGTEVFFTQWLMISLSLSSSFSSPSNFTSSFFIVFSPSPLMKKSWTPLIYLNFLVILVLIHIFIFTFKVFQIIGLHIWTAAFKQVSRMFAIK